MVKGGQYWKGVEADRAEAVKTLAAARESQKAAQKNQENLSHIFSEFSAIRNSWVDPMVGLELSIVPKRDLKGSDLAIYQNAVRSLGQKRNLDMFRKGLSESLRSSPYETLDGDKLSLGKSFGELRLLRLALLRQPMDFKLDLSSPEETKTQSGLQLMAFAAEGDLLVIAPDRLGKVDCQLPLDASDDEELTFSTSPMRTSVVKRDKNYTSLDDLKGSQVLLTLACDPKWDLVKQMTLFMDKQFALTWQLADGRTCSVPLKQYFAGLPALEVARTNEIYLYGTFPDSAPF
jgi:hypothetical protein